MRIQKGRDLNGVRKWKKIVGCQDPEQDDAQRALTRGWTGIS